MRRFPNDDDDDDAFDERGVLRDGRVFRVKMTAMDALQRAVAAESAKYWPRNSAPLVTDANGTTIGLHQPGFVFSADAAARDAYWDARADYERDLTNAWRDAAAAISEGTVEPHSKEDALPTRDAAYKIYDQEISNRWRGQQ